MITADPLGNSWSKPKKQTGMQVDERIRLERGVRRTLHDVYPELTHGDRLDYVLEKTVSTIDACRMELSAPTRWIYLRLSHADAAVFLQAIEHDVAPSVIELGQTFPVSAWWWLSKRDPVGAAIRLRVEVPTPCAPRAERELGKKLAGRGFDVRVLRYEPEMKLFGGAIGMKIAHELFYRDSEFLVRWPRCGARSLGPLIPVGLSLAIMVCLTGAVRLDTFERWDVFAQLSDTRPLRTNGDHSQECQYENLAGKIISLGPRAVFDLYGGQEGEILRNYVVHLRDCGLLLSRAYFNGELECGLREFLVPVFVFHLNRVGLSWGAQARVANAMKEVLRRLIRNSSTQES